MAAAESTASFATSFSAMAAGLGYQADTVVRIETNLDDLSPELLAPAVARLLGAGALDATLAPLQMKKGRPGVLLSVLCEPAALPQMAALIFAETTAFGIRFERLERWKLDRRFETVATPWGEVTVKLGLRGAASGADPAIADAPAEVLQIAPEFESCRAASGQSGQPLRAVYQAALEAARNIHAAP